MNDLRFAFRQLVKHHGFTAVAVLTLAIGIGANTAIFSIVDTVLVKPLPYEQPGQLVQVWEAPGPGGQNSVSPGAFLDWKEHNTVFESLSLRQGASMNLTGDGEPDVGYNIDFNFCSPDYFRATGIPLLKGRPFDRRDRANSSRVVIINEALAREHFPNQDPLGRRIHLDVFTGKIDEGWEIVGVAGNVRQRGLGERVRSCVYRPLVFSAYGGGGNLIIRTRGAPLALADSVRKAVQEVDPGQPVANVRTMEEVIAALVAQRRFILMLLGGFAGTALLLAAIGLYGVIAYAVSQRRREIGIRIALGARRGDVLALTRRQGMKLVGIGLALGVAGALGLTRFLAAQLYTVMPTDPLTFAGVVLAFVAVTSAACLIPAFRAARVDPVEALRCE